MSKLSLSDIKNGGLVHKTHLVTVEFLTLEDDPASVEIQLKQLPYVQTEKLHKRFAEDDPKVVSEWIAQSIVDDDGNPEFTAKQVDELFSGELVKAILDQIFKVEQVKKLAKAKRKA